MTNYGYNSNILRTRQTRETTNPVINIVTWVTTFIIFLYQFLFYLCNLVYCNLHF